MTYGAAPITVGKPFTDISREFHAGIFGEGNRLHTFDIRWHPGKEPWTRFLGSAYVILPNIQLVSNGIPIYDGNLHVIAEPYFSRSIQSDMVRIPEPTNEQYGVWKQIVEQRTSEWEAGGNYGDARKRAYDEWRKVHNLLTSHYSLGDIVDIVAHNKKTGQRNPVVVKAQEDDVFAVPACGLNTAQAYFVRRNQRPTILSQVLGAQAIPFNFYHVDGLDNLVLQEKLKPEQAQELRQSIYDAWK